jgi:hypothetical protein
MDKLAGVALKRVQHFYYKTGTHGGGGLQAAGWPWAGRGWALWLREG